jgi:hypothetical protein
MWLTVTRVDQHLDELESIIVKHDRVKQERIEWNSYAPGFGTEYWKCGRGSKEEKRITPRAAKEHVFDEDAFYEYCKPMLTDSPFRPSKLAPFQERQASPEYQVRYQNPPAPIPKPKLKRELVVEDADKPLETISSDIREELYQRMVTRELERRIEFIEWKVEKRFARIKDAINRRFPDEIERDKYSKELRQTMRQQEMDRYK